MISSRLWWQCPPGLHTCEAMIQRQREWRTGSARGSICRTGAHHSLHIPTDTELLRKEIPGDRFLSSAGTGKNYVLCVRLPNPSPVLGKNRAPIGPEILSSTGARVLRKAPNAFSDFNSALDKFQAAKKFPENLLSWILIDSAPSEQPEKKDFRFFMELCVKFIISNSLMGSFGKESLQKSFRKLPRNFRKLSTELPHPFLTQ